MQHNYSANAPHGDAELKLTNRVGESRSPYVRSHISNPVAWQLWNAETLALAKKHDRLLFVSIGYASCHWCHVMSHDSFSDPSIARLLNTSFIPVKLDRDERPDLDRIYMNYVQATTGSGGWPLNVFLTPHLQPLFGGTYWPASHDGGAGAGLGFKDVLEKVRGVWREQRARCVDEAGSVTEALRRFAEEGTVSVARRAGGAARMQGGDGVAEQELGADELDLELLEEAVEHYAARFDGLAAGFSKAPKFPTPSNLRFLLRLGGYPGVVGDVVGAEEVEGAARMAVETLVAMARGGIHDQVGGGYARYSVTRDWGLPHFEKMLYDQGQLVQAFLDAAMVCWGRGQRDKAREMLEQVVDVGDYLTSRPMMREGGGFFTAEDADSLYRVGDQEKREGAFYVWTLKELQSILGERDSQVVAKYYGVEKDGNVPPEFDTHDELIDQNVLRASSSEEALAKEFGLSKEDVEKVIQQGKKKLLEHRERERPRPALDDKIVVSWNGLAIGGLARASATLSSLDEKSDRAKRYLVAAEKAAAFIRKELFDEQSGAMKRVYREGPGDTPAFADDYAFLISGLIDLYEAAFDDQYLRWADRLQKTQIKLFWDDHHGGFYSTAEGQEDLILRLKDGMDSAEPSTNGVSAQNLNRLASLFEDEEYRKKASETLAAFEAEILQHPFLFVGLLDAVVVERLGMRGVIVSGEGRDVERVVRKERFGVGAARTVSRIGKGARSDGWLRERNVLLKHMDPEKSVVQICEKGACREYKEGEMDSSLIDGDLPDLEKLSL